MTKSKKSPKKKKNKLAIALILVIFILITLRLGRDRLFDWDEAIYAELGKNILSYKGLLTPIWNGEIWLEKPPGIAWITAIGMSLFGVSEIGARIFMPVFAALTLYFVYLIAEKFTNKKGGILSVLILSNMNLFLSRSRALNTDGPLLTGIVAAVYGALSGFSVPAMALIISLSVLVKGLAGFLPLLIIAPLYLNKLKEYFKLAIYTILISAPWHIYQYLVNGEKFLTPYFKEQVVRRVTVPIEFHLESRYYYFNYLYEHINTAILVFSVISILFLLFKYWKKRSPKSLLLPWWALLPLGIFTLAKTRLFWYILPIYPALAILVSYLIYTLAKDKRARLLLTVFLLLYTPFTFKNILQDIEYDRTTQNSTAKIDLVLNLSGERELIVLVPEQERIAEAILPKDQRISSSFRYGGAPSIAFYHYGNVKYFYDIPDFINYWDNANAGDVQALISSSDLSMVDDYKIHGQKEDHTTIIKK